MNQMHRFSDHVLVVPVFPAISRTAAFNSAALDVQQISGPYSRVTLCLTLGSHDRGTGDETLDIKVQESDTGTGGWTDVPGASFAQIAGGAIPAAGFVALMDINLERRKRFLRTVSTPAGTTPIDVYGINAFFYRGGIQPRTQVVTPIGVEQ